MRLVLQPNTPDQKTVEVDNGIVTVGRAQDNMIVLADQTAADYHALLQHDGEAWLVRDIAGRGDVLVDDQPVQSAKIALGSRIRFAATSAIVIALGRQDTEVVRMTPVIETSVVQLQSTQMAHHMCPSCGSSLQPGARFCPLCGITTMPAQMAPPHTSVMPRLALLFSLLGPVLLGIGWLLGGILGIVALVRHQRYGGRTSDREIAWWAVLLSLMWIMLIGGGGAWFGSRYAIGLRIQYNEDRVRSLLRSVAMSQICAKYSGASDNDRDGISEFASFDTLAKIAVRPDVALLARSPLYGGYYFSMTRADETGFCCIAVPRPYGVNGRNSYFVDERGAVMGDDVRGDVLDHMTADIVSNAMAYSVLTFLGNELAGDLATLAERALDSKDYPRAMAIAANVRRLFPASPVLKRLVPTETQAAQRMAEADANRLYKEAEDLIARKQPQALDVLRKITGQYTTVPVADLARRAIVDLTSSNATAAAATIEQLCASNTFESAFGALNALRGTYPEASAAPPLRQSLAAIEARIVAAFEIEATNLIAQARAKEEAGEYENAHMMLLSVKTRFGVTQAARSIDDLVARNRSLTQEREAARLVDTIVQLSPATNMARIIELADLLKRGYAHTEKFKQNQPMLSSLELECQRLKHVTAAREHLEQKSYRAALASIELAIKCNSNLVHTLKADIQLCYLGLGDAAYENQDYVQALDYYQKYLALKPSENRINERRFMECNFEAAKAHVQKRDFANAEKYLIACAPECSNDPEFDFLFGCTLMHLGRWLEAVQHLVTCIDPLKPHSNESQIYLAFCQYQIALREEDSLRSQLMDDDDLLRLARDFSVTFSVDERTNLPCRVTTTPARPAAAKTFLDLALDICIALDTLATETDRLKAMSQYVYVINVRGERDRTRNEAWHAQWSRVRTLQLPFPNQLYVLRASASADAIRKSRIKEQLASTRKWFEAISRSMAPTFDRMRNPELSKIADALKAKITAYQNTEQLFNAYVDLEEQRRQTIIVTVDTLVKSLDDTSLSTTVIKQRTAELRNMHSSTKESECALKALHTLASSYAIFPNVASVLLANPATAETMRAIAENPSLRIPVTIETR